MDAIGRSGTGKHGAMASVNGFNLLNLYKLRRENAAGKLRPVNPLPRDG